jgi:hypothetical protein
MEGIRLLFCSMFISFFYIFRATVSIFGRNNCIYVTLGTSHSMWTTVWYAGSFTHSDKYQVSHRYSCFSRWWAHGRPKHIEKRNKHTKKNCAPRWLYLQVYTRIHGQQNIKLCYLLFGCWTRWQNCLVWGNSGKTF